jgi:hypothetical protein
MNSRPNIVCRNKHVVEFFTWVADKLHARCMCCEILRHWLLGFIFFSFLIGGCYGVLWSIDKFVFLK